MYDTAMIVVLRSIDPDKGPWTPLLRQQVPKQISNPDCIGRMLGGEIAQAVDDGPYWYRAVKADEIDVTNKA